MPAGLGQLACRCIRENPVANASYRQHRHRQHAFLPDRIRFQDVQGVTAQRGEADCCCLMLSLCVAMGLSATLLELGPERSTYLTTEVIDDLSQPAPRASNGAFWELIADRVMGGVSNGEMRREVVQGRKAIHVQGNVSLDNNGGFLQIALDLTPDGGTIDASHWSGIEIDVMGNGESYNLHLRTADVTRPWQSYRQGFVARQEWRMLRLAFADFAPHRIEAPLDIGALRRIGIVAIGRAFRADFAIGGVRFHL